MRGKAILILILAHLHHHAKSQQIPASDSLRKVYLSQKNDSIRIEKQLQYIGSLLKVDKDFVQAEREMKQVREKNNVAEYPATLPWLNYYEALILYYNTQYISSIVLSEKAIRLTSSIEESPEVLRCIASSYNLIGLNYSNINDWENAQANYQKSINSLERINDSSGITLIYLNMAYIFYDYQDWINSELSLKKGLQYIASNNERSYLIMIYSTLADIYAKTGKFHEARFYLSKSDSVLRSDQKAESYLFNHLANGEYFYHQRKYDDALPFGLSAVSYARKWYDSTFVISALELTARIYRGKKDYHNAALYLSSSLTIAENNNYLAQRKTGLREQINLYTEIGQFEKALSTSEKLISITDSLTMIMNNNRRIINDASFESEKKEKKISTLEEKNELQHLRLEQKNYFNYILIVSSLSILIFSFLSYHNYRQKQKLQQQRINELETQQQLTAAEAMLKGEEQERARLAKDLHDGLGGMLSGIKYSFTNIKRNDALSTDNLLALDRSIDMLDSSIQEMRRVAHNMMPEGLVKFGLDTALNDFCNDINNSGALNITYQSIDLGNAVIGQTTSITIYRVVQELVNNIMKHASARSAIVQITNMNGLLSLTVEDNGKGFDTGILKRSTGMGWSNIQNRVEFLKGTVDIQSSATKGTSVHIEISI